MEKVKPILVVKMPFDTDEEILKQTILNINETGYQPLIYTSQDESVIDPEFQVFYDKDFNEAKYEELQKMVIDSLKS